MRRIIYGHQTIWNSKKIHTAQESKLSPITSASDDDGINNSTSVEHSPRECCIFSTTGNTSSNDMISFPPSPIFASRAAKSASSFSNIEVMAGVSCDGSMIENLGRSVHSRRGLVDVVGGGLAEAASAVDDMARAVVVVAADAAAAAVEGQEAR